MAVWATIVYARGFLKFALFANCDKFNFTVKDMKFVKFLALFIVLAASSVAAVAQDKNTGTIKGRVRVEKGSAAGVLVVLRQGDRDVRRVETDRKGEFTMR